MELRGYTAKWLKIQHKNRSLNTDHWSNSQHRHVVIRNPHSTLRLISGLEGGAFEHRCFARFLQVGDYKSQEIGPGTEGVAVGRYHTFRLVSYGFINPSPKAAPLVNPQYPGVAEPQRANVGANVDDGQEKLGDIVPRVLLVVKLG